MVSGNLVFAACLKRESWYFQYTGLLRGILHISSYGAPSRKGCVVSGRMTEASKTRLRPLPPPPLPPLPVLCSSLQTLLSRRACKPAVHCTKFLQIWIANRNPGESAASSKLDLFGICFNTTPPKRHPCRDSTRSTPVPPRYHWPLLHPRSSTRIQPLRSLSRLKYGNTRSCPQLSGVNLNSRKQNHASKRRIRPWTITWVSTASRSW